MRRIIQSTGVEVIHLGHDRSVEEVVNTAIQEDANAIAITSYQEDITNILSTCMTCFKERSGQIKILAVEVV
jgi:methylmalonyl-CoA mutase